MLTTTSGTRSWSWMKWYTARGRQGISGAASEPVSIFTSPDRNAARATRAAALPWSGCRSFKALAITTEGCNRRIAEMTFRKLSSLMSKKPSASPKFSRCDTPRMPAAAVASAARISAEPLVPSSPLVKSTIAHVLPSAASLAKVPPADNSTSSGWAPNARTSTCTVEWLMAQRYSALPKAPRKPLVLEFISLIPIFGRSVPTTL